MCKHWSWANLHFLGSCKLGNVDVCNLFKLFLTYKNASPQLIKKPEKNICYFDCLIGDMLPSAISSIVA